MKFSKQKCSCFAFLCILLPAAVEGWVSEPLLPAKNVATRKELVHHFGTFVPPKDAAWVLATPLTKTITYGPMNNEMTSMDRVTSIEPVHPSLPKLWLITLHSQSLTRAAFKDSKTGILHCLSAEQKEDVGDVLSKRCGYHNDFHFSKRAHCAEKGLDWKPYFKTWEKTDATNEDYDELLTDGELVEMEETLSEMDVLPRSDAYLKMKLLKTIPAGDHSIAMCEMVGFGQWDDTSGKLVMKRNLQLAPAVPLGVLIP
jgi:hypothetical protein